MDGNESVPLNEVKSCEIARDKIPKAHDINRLVVPKCAANWRELGEALGIVSHKLNNIKADFPNNSEECCKVMLRRWLREDKSATWGKLLDAIHSSTLPYIIGGVLSRQLQSDELKKYIVMIAQTEEDLENADTITLREFAESLLLNEACTFPNEMK